ncbi:hypothetical protein [Cupriavidus sp.]|uniref:hypothetical protein n=1 Tax=Cupriavidus sp. TaxID=1873897 RepID=UPI003D1501E8
MRLTPFASLSLSLACASALATPAAPTPAQVTAAIQQFEAERIKQLEQTDPAAAERARSPVVASLVASIKAHAVKGCLPASAGEIVCIVGVRAGLRDGYRALAFRDNPEPWVLVRRETPDVNGPDAAQATAAMREFARAELKKNPAGEHAAELTSMAESLVVKQLNHCGLSRDSGNLGCDAMISVGGAPEKRVTGFAFALEPAGWRFLPRSTD